VGERGNSIVRFMDAEVTNLIHMPLVPAPPGIGLFVNQHAGRMNMVLTYVDGMLADEDARRILDDARRLL
jgi:hypothetical protein